MLTPLSITSLDQGKLWEEPSPAPTPQVMRDERQRARRPWLALSIFFSQMGPSPRVGTGSET